MPAGMSYVHNVSYRAISPAVAIARQQSQAAAVRFDDGLRSIDSQGNWVNHGGCGIGGSTVKGTDVHVTIEGSESQQGGIRPDRYWCLGVAVQRNPLVALAPDVRGFTAVVQLPTDHGGRGATVPGDVRIYCAVLVE